MRTAATGPRLTSRYRDGSRAPFSATLIDPTDNSINCPNKLFRELVCFTKNNFNEKGQAVTDLPQIDRASMLPSVFPQRCYPDGSNKAVSSRSELVLFFVRCE